MGDMGLKKSKGCWIKIVLGTTLAVLLAYLLLPQGSGDVVNGRLVQCLNNSQQIQLIALSEASDHAIAAGGKGGFPADIGVKSGLEYVRYLVQVKAIKETDISIFCKPEKKAYSLAKLNAENIAFRFANVSEKDSPETVFIVTRNVVEGMPAPKKWWDFSKDDPFAKAYVVMRLGGDGSFYTAKSPPDLKTLGDLPPREPKFLEP